MIGDLMDLAGHAGRFTAEQENVPVPIGKIGVGALRLGRKQDEPPRGSSAPRREGGKIDMAA